MQNIRKIEGGLFGDSRKENFEQSHNAEKCEKRDPLQFLAFVLLQKIKKIEGGTGLFGDSEKNKNKDF